MSITHIINGNVFLSGRNFVRADLEIAEGRISSIYISGADQLPESSDQVLDATGLNILPGLVDIHLHGCAEHDFCEGTPEAFEAIEQYELRHGITTILPTTMTLPMAELTRILNAANEYRMREDMEHLIMRGVNLEGPFLSKTYCGAHNPAFLAAPNAQTILKLWESSGGLPRIISIAPELPGAIDCIKELSEVMTVSLAHTDANYKIAKEAFAQGADHVTHLFNAMRPCLHRSPGVIGAALDCDANIELICDGYHVHPSVVRGVFRMFDTAHIILISDSMMGTGGREGEGFYQLGGQDITVFAGAAMLAGTNMLAGSVTNLYDCMVNAIEFGVPENKAIAAATINPARSVGLEGKVGSIDPGLAADLLLVDAEYNLKGVIKAGNLVK